MLLSTSYERLSVESIVRLVCCSKDCCAVVESFDEQNAKAVLPKAVKEAASRRSSKANHCSVQSSRWVTRAAGKQAADDSIAAVVCNDSKCPF